jgi:hypothetical protein
MGKGHPQTFCDIYVFWRFRFVFSDAIRFVTMYVMLIFTFCVLTICAATFSNIHVC